ncbi:unnamed protein product [Brassica oleracea var. botrytis]
MMRISSSVLFLEMETDPRNPKEISSETFSGIDDGNNRIGQDCSKDNIVVEIFNACVSDCRIAEIHVSCGWFSSVRMVNPRVFRRISYGDCLVNDGQPLAPGQTLF